MPRPSLHEMLYGNFSGGLDINDVSEQNQLILSVLDNMQRILNSRAGSIKHLPDYGLPDMTRILQGMPGTAHQLMTTFSSVFPACRRTGHYVTGNSLFSRRWHYGLSRQSRWQRNGGNN